MKRWRYQAPARSPLSTRAVLAGFGAVVRNGPTRSRAETRVIELITARYSPSAVLLTDTGTTALTAALIAILQNGRGRPVALPAYACYDLATAAEGAGAAVLLYDVDPHTLAPDLAQLRAVLRRGAAAVVVVHAYGYPVDVSEVLSLASETGAIVIEDAAQAAGATRDGRPVGSHGSLAVLSFGRGKGLTGGSGGAILAFDRPGARLVERMSALLGPPRRGWEDVVAVSAQLLFERPGLYAVPATLPYLRLGETIYRAPRPMRQASSVSATVVAATWHLAEREVELRRANGDRLLSELRQHRGFETIVPIPNARPGYLRLPVLGSPRVRRSATEPATRRLGVMPGYPMPLCDLEPFGARCLNRDDHFPGSRSLAASVCTLPTHGRLGLRDLERLELWIRAAGRQ